MHLPASVRSTEFAESAAATSAPAVATAAAAAAGHGSAISSTSTTTKGMAVIITTTTVPTAPKSAVAPSAAADFHIPVALSNATTSTSTESCCRCRLAWPQPARNHWDTCSWVRLSAATGHQPHQLARARGASPERFSSFRYLSCRSTSRTAWGNRGKHPPRSSCLTMPERPRD